jgi:hypothetical protein
MSSLESYETGHVDGYNIQKLLGDVCRVVDPNGHGTDRMQVRP